jgi:hypothetical protein
MRNSNLIHSYFSNFFTLETKGMRKGGVLARERRQISGGIGKLTHGLSYFVHHLRRRLEAEDSDVSDNELIELVPRDLGLNIHP